MQWRDNANTRHSITSPLSTLPLQEPPVVSTTPNMELQALIAQWTMAGFADKDEMFVGMWVKPWKTCLWSLLSIHSKSGPDTCMSCFPHVFLYSGTNTSAGIQHCSVLHHYILSCWERVKYQNGSKVDKINTYRRVTRLKDVGLLRGIQWEVKPEHPAAQRHKKHHVTLNKL